MPARRPVSRVLSRRSRSGDGHPSRDAGCPTPLAADPRAGRRTPFRRSGPRLPSYLALLRVELARFTPARPTFADLPARHCGAGPRLTADGCYPLPCVAELGLSSCRSTGHPDVARDHPAASLTPLSLRRGKPSPPTRDGLARVGRRLRGSLRAHRSAVGRGTGHRRGERSAERSTEPGPSVAVTRPPRPSTCGRSGTAARHVDDVAHLGVGQRDQVRVAVHEADPAAVLHDRDRVAGQQRAATSAPAAQWSTVAPGKWPRVLISVTPGRISSAIPFHSRSPGPRYCTHSPSEAWM